MQGVVLAGDFGPSAMVWPDILDLASHEQTMPVGLPTMSLIREMKIDDTNCGFLYRMATRPKSDAKCKNKGSLDVFQYLTCHGLLPECIRPDLFAGAAIRGNLHLCKYLAETPVTINSPRLVRLLRRVIGGGHIEVAKYLIDAFKITRNHHYFNNDTIMVDAVVTGDIQFCQWVKDKFELTKTDVLNFGECTCLRATCAEGMLDMCEWFVTAFGLTKTTTQLAVEFAAFFGQVTVCQWFIQRSNCDKSDSELGLRLLGSAVEHENIALCRWLVNYFGLTADQVQTENILLTASSHKTVRVCQWLVDFFGFTTLDVENLPSNGFSKYRKEWLLKNVKVPKPEKDLKSKIAHSNNTKSRSYRRRQRRRRQKERELIEN